MLAFVHMHKCAGTTVVKSARKSRLALPKHHRNGNLLVEPDGRTLRYDGMDRAEFDKLIETLKADDTGFFALEMDFPPVDYLIEHGIEVFTVIRDPLKRAISNFRYAKNRGNVEAATPFRDFLNRSFTRDGPISRASNYYARKLCQLPPTLPMTEDHLDRALATLARFRAVIVLEQGRLESELEALGIDRIKTTRTTEQLTSKVALTADDLAVSDEDQAWFVAGNALDFELYDRMCRASTAKRAT